MQLPLALPLAYLIGGVPFGFLAVKLILGKDVRQSGSGNIGATNVGRCFPGAWRWVAFVAIYLLDFLKGCLPVVLLGAPQETAWGPAAIGLAAILGHCFTPYLRLKGGKGVATTCGVLCALDWVALLVALAVFGLVLCLTRVTALGSMALGVALALAVILREPSTAFEDRWSVSALAVFLAFFLVWTHRSNIRQLLARRSEATG